MKKLNYANMNCITWGAVRELIEENKNLKNKVEHLESIWSWKFHQRLC